MDDHTKEEIRRRDFKNLKIKYRVNKVKKRETSIFQDLDDGYLIEIGKTVIRFQIIENSISDMLQKLLNLNPSSGTLIMENLSYKKKVTTLGSLLKVNAERWNRNEKEKIDINIWNTIITHLFLVENVRNRIVHSSWVTYKRNKPPTRIKPSYKKSGYSLTREKILLKDLKEINKWILDIDKILHLYMKNIIFNQKFIDDAYKIISPRHCKIIREQLLKGSHQAQNK